MCVYRNAVSKVQKQPIACFPVNDLKVSDTADKHVWKIEKVGGTSYALGINVFIDSCKFCMFWFVTR